MQVEGARASYKDTEAERLVLQGWLRERSLAGELHDEE